MNNMKRQFMIFCSIIFALVFALSTASVSAVMGDTWTSISGGGYSYQVAVINGKIYAMGGSDGVVKEYNPKINMWTTKSSMPTVRSYYKIAVVGEKIYLIGGIGSNGYVNSVEEYDTVTDIWTPKANMSVARISNQVEVVDGKIYVIGGTTDTDPDPIRSVEEYDPATDTWTTKASMNNGRMDFQSAVIGGKIYVLGGLNYNNSKMLEEYDPAVDTWTNKTPMSGIRTSFETVVVNGKIYAIGGYGDGNGNAINSVEEYNPETNIWVAKASMSAARVSFEVAAAEGKIYAMCGATDAKGSVEEYDTFTNKWTARASMDDERSNFKTVVLNEKIYAIGGSVGNYNTDSVEVYMFEYPAPLNLKAVAGNSKVNLFWDECKNATSYSIKRSEKSGDSYKTIATVPTESFTDTMVTSGTTYYYVVTGVKNDVESQNSAEASATPENSGVTLEVTSADRAKVGDVITANVVIHDAVNICAEDIKVAFDTSKLEFVSDENADGIKICKEDSIAEDKRSYITASLGKANAANGDKVLLKLTFKAKASGEAKIDITNGRIADNADLESDIEEKNCGEKIVSIVEGNSKDVNRSGDFTLLDLGIDAWYYGDAAANTDTSKYDADVVANGTIDNDDLEEIVKQMLVNAAYPAASKG